MDTDVKFRPDLKTPEPAVVVFGRDGAGKAHASWFDAEAAPLAIKAAALMGMQVLTVATAEHRQLVERFARGRVFASGRAFTPFVREKAFAELLKIAETATPPAASAQIADGTNAPAAPASAQSQEAEGSPGDKPSGGTADAPVGPTAEQPVTGGGAVAADTGVPRPITWDEIGVGSLVLALEAPDEGWWPSLVVGVRDEFVSLKWHGFPKLPMFTRRRTELALLPPSY